MFELEDIKLELKELEKRLNELGESLWYSWQEKASWRARRANKSKRILDRYGKISKGFARNKSIER